METANSFSKHLKAVPATIGGLLVLASIDLKFARDRIEREVQSAVAEISSQARKIETITLKEIERERKESLEQYTQWNINLARQIEKYCRNGIKK